MFRFTPVLELEKEATYVDRHHVELKTHTDVSYLKQQEETVLFGLSF